MGPVNESFSGPMSYPAASGGRTEAKLADLEGGQDALAFGSGMAAESATFLAHTRARGAHRVPG
jgi:cystathionine beta-lyase/cystathionine gamma-synthase